MPDPSSAPAAAVAAAPGAALTVTGRTPAASGEFPSIVILEPKSGPQPTPQAAMPVMDQVQQTFTPQLLLVRTGQPVEFRNDDDVLHNVRVREDASRAPAFNVAIPTGEKYQFTFDRDGFYDVGCDIHPAMAAQIVATTSPYATVADREGQFAMEGVPAGDYHATVYSGALRIDRDITVSATTATVDLSKP